MNLNDKTHCSFCLHAIVTEVEDLLKYELPDHNDNKLRYWRVPKWYSFMKKMESLNNITISGDALKFLEEEIGE